MGRGRRPFRLRFSYPLRSRRAFRERFRTTKVRPITTFMAANRDRKDVVVPGTGIGLFQRHR